MVKENKYYTCKICKLKYLKKSWADKCYKWCKKYNSCSIEITKYALNK